jgi:hypothetical protein
MAFAADTPDGQRGTMDQFVARENIRHCRDQLMSEIDPAKRAILQKILVEEEDKLGALFELIAEVKREIARAKTLIEERQTLVASMEREKRGGIENVKALLDGLMQTQTLHEEYCKKLLYRVQAERLAASLGINLAIDKTPSGRTIAS